MLFYIYKKIPHSDKRSVSYAALWMREWRLTKSFFIGLTFKHERISEHPIPCLGWNKGWPEARWQRPCPRQQAHLKGTLCLCQVVQQCQNSQCQTNIDHVIGNTRSNCKYFPCELKCFLLSDQQVKIKWECINILIL